MGFVVWMVVTKPKRKAKVCIKPKSKNDLQRKLNTQLEMLDYLNNLKGECY